MKNRVAFEPPNHGDVMETWKMFIIVGLILIVIYYALRKYEKRTKEKLFGWPPKP